MERILKKINGVVVSHKWIILCSFFMAILIFAPLIFFPIIIKEQYQGININHFGTDAHFYLTRGKEILDGNNLGSSLLREGKDEQDPFFSYSEYILLAPIKLLGLEQEVDVVIVYNFYNFIGIFLLILLVYYLVLQLSGDKLLSAAAALFMIGGYSIVYFKTLFYNDFNVYARLINPYVSSLALFFYLNLLVKSLKSIEAKYKILSALVFGLLFYVYFFAWSFAVVLNAFLFLIFFLKKDFTSVKKIIFISFIGLIFGFYNLINLFLSFNSEVGRQQSYFHWMSYGHLPIFSKIGFVSLLLFLVFWYKQKKDGNWPIVLATILSGWVVLNQQIITGRLLQYGHYYWYFIVPLSIVTGFYMIWQLIENEKWKKYLFVFIIILVFVNTVGGQYKSFFTTFEVKKYEQNFRPIINYLNADKTPGVILAPTSQVNSYLFAIYTPHDLFWHNAAPLSQVPIQRFKDALFAYSYINKESRNDFIGYFERTDDFGSNRSFYQRLYWNLEGYWSGFSYEDYNYKVATNDKDLSQKRPEIINQLNEEYEKMVSGNNGINELLKKYDVNYIIWDKNMDQEWDLSVIKGLKQVASHNNIYLYSIAN